MFNPNSSRTPSHMESVENALTRLTPDPENFANSIYPLEDVRSDEKQLADFKGTPDYKRGEERSDAKLLEKTFTDMVERGDWFGEDALYGDDPEYLALVTFPTHEIDDTFNHIDVIGMVNNETTGHETMPFAIDLTYNTDDDKMSRKFKWKHVREKKNTAPEGASEFGISQIEQDYYGRDVLRTRSLPLKFRYGLKIPGFASAKYFEDKNNPWDPMYDKGRIPIMPRFIVGYSPDLADTLADGMPTNEFRSRYGEQAYQKKRQEFQDAEMRAKWCTLFECSEQASDMRYMLENLTDEDTKYMQPEELATAKKQIVAMDTYFAKAIEVAEHQAQTDPRVMDAMKYADRDVVRREIMRHSSDTYVGKNW